MARTRAGRGVEVDLGRVLLDLLVVLVAARLAAEAAERLKQPAVLAEIVIGILIGPSALGLVGKGDSLRILGEIGVVLLLFEVGRQMDLREMGRVGGASLRVATIGVVVPMALGIPVLHLLGVTGSPALFLAAGITATSVGITARVFGDLRALATPEARTVLGAAVADDVIGLLILTVVTRTAGGSSLSAASLIGIIGAALGFVVAATVVGAWLAPRILDELSRRSRTDGTVMALGLAIAVGFARLASAARLAPIVGSFVAGLSVGRSEMADDLHRRLTPLGHFFIPIFFLQIGIDTQIRVFKSASVLKVAAALSVCAVVGKLVSGLGAARGGDRSLVGIAMIPRGEVGLIFASLGLSRGILNANQYAVLLLVVLVSTLITPPWMRVRIERVRRRAITRHAGAVEPDGGWLDVGESEVELAADPPSTLAPRLGLEAALLCRGRRPGTKLLEWLGASSQESVEWDEPLREAFFRLMQEGTERSWRFLEVTGLLGRLLPDLATAISRRPRDPFELEPGSSMGLGTLLELRSAVRGMGPAAGAWASLKNRELLAFAALLRGALEADRDPPEAARRIASHMGLTHDAGLLLGFLVGERHLLPAAAARLDLNEDRVLDLASYMESPERAAGLYLLAVAEDAMEPWERERLDEVYRLVIDALAHPDLTGPRARNLVEQRLSEVGAVGKISESQIRQALMAAPRRYLLAQGPGDLTRHLRMTHPRPGRFEAHVDAERSRGLDEWTLHVAVLDRQGVLASIAGALAAMRVSVHDAAISTWRNGIAIDVFRVQAPPGTDWDAVRRRIDAALSHHENGVPHEVVEGSVDIDNLASPWHTILEVHAKDRSGLLYRVASALSRAGLQIHQATVTTRGSSAVDTFWVTGRNGGKLDAAGERDLRQAFAGKAPRRWRLARRQAAPLP